MGDHWRDEWIERKWEEHMLKNMHAETHFKTSYEGFKRGLGKVE
jgi:hypothetical protein